MQIKTNWRWIKTKQNKARQVQEVKQSKTKQNNPEKEDGHDAPSSTIKNGISVKPTMAMPTNDPTKPTESPNKPTELLEGPTKITERKPDVDADAPLVSTEIKPRTMNPKFYTLYYVDSEPSSATTATAPATTSAAAPTAAPAVKSDEKTASSEDIPAPTNAPATASAAATVEPKGTNETESEVKSAPLVPPVSETAPSEDISAPDNALATAPAAAPTAAPAVTLKPRIPKPVANDPNYGHQPSDMWPNETTAILPDGATYRRYDDDIWRPWNPRTPWVISEEPEACIGRFLDLQQARNYQHRKKATPATVLPALLAPSSIEAPTPAVTPTPVRPKEKVSIPTPPEALSVGNGEAPPSPSTPEEKVSSPLAAQPAKAASPASSLPLVSSSSGTKPEIEKIREELYERMIPFATAACFGIEDYQALCTQIADMMPTMNTADSSTVQSKIISMKDAQGPPDADILDSEALRCEFRAMQAQPPPGRSKRPNWVLETTIHFRKYWYT
jgi:hypothetical protein